MTRVVVTGSEGTIGSVTVDALKDSHDVAALDVKSGDDITDFEYLLEQVRDADVIIHLAHSAEEPRENWRSNSVHPKNVEMELNVFRAAIEANVGRVVVASSVHADNFHGFFEHSPGSMMVVNRQLEKPITPYGQHKLFMEALGEHYASEGKFEFVAIRFGGVSADNSVKTDPPIEQNVWLSHDDLSELMRAIVDADSVPDGFEVLYAVSDNDGRLHATTNSFGWEPRDNSADYLN